MPLALQTCIANFCKPAVFQSDNGSSLVPAIEALTYRFGFESVTSRPYASQSQGKCENLNRQLRVFVYDHLRQFQSKFYLDRLDFPRMTVNNRPGATGMTPLQIYVRRNNQPQLPKVLALRRKKLDQIMIKALSSAPDHPIAAALGGGRLPLSRTERAEPSAAAGRHCEASPAPPAPALPVQRGSLQSERAQGDCAGLLGSGWGGLMGTLERGVWPGGWVESLA